MPSLYYLYSRLGRQEEEKGKIPKSKLIAPTCPHKGTQQQNHNLESEQVSRYYFLLYFLSLFPNTASYAHS